MTGFGSHRQQPGQIYSPITLECKLFSDKVSEQLCLLRRKELHLKGNFSCEGCVMDEIVSKQLRLVQEVLGIG